jgi:hypothetical protein
MTFASFMTDFNLVLAGLVAAFIAGVLLSTKVKDIIKGVPSAARVAINNVEADALAKLKNAQTNVLATLPGAPPAPKVALAPLPLPAPAPVAPVPAAAATV